MKIQDFPIIPKFKMVRESILSTAEVAPRTQGCKQECKQECKNDSWCCFFNTALLINNMLLINNTNEQLGRKRPESDPGATRERPGSDPGALWAAAGPPRAQHELATVGADVKSDGGAHLPRDGSFTVEFAH